MAGTSADKLALLQAIKDDLKAALTEKGQAPGDVFAEYPSMVRAIKTGTQLPELTSPGAAADLRQGKQLIDQEGNVVDGTLADVEQATPGVSLDAAGLITASAEQAAGYVAAGTKGTTLQLTTQAAKTVTPGTSAQTAVASGRYTTGAVTVAGDANLVPENIKSGVSIFGVAGTAATASDDAWEIAFFSTDSRYPSSDVFSGEYENSLETNGYLRMNLTSEISDYKVMSVCAVYDDYLLTLMLTQLPETAAYDAENFPLGGFRYWETDDESGYDFYDAVSCDYFSLGPYISISLSGRQYPFSPDHVYAYIAIKR